VEPLLEEALRELQYLQEVDLSLQELGSFEGEADLGVLEEVRILERPPETRQGLHTGILWARANLMGLKEGTVRVLEKGRNKKVFWAWCQTSAFWRGWP
jgi:hypothetical protein